MNFEAVKINGCNYLIEMVFFLKSNNLQWKSYDHIIPHDRHASNRSHYGLRFLFLIKILREPLGEFRIMYMYKYHFTCIPPIIIGNRVVCMPRVPHKIKYAVANRETSIPLYNQKTWSILTYKIPNRIRMDVGFLAKKSSESMTLWDMRALWLLF